MSTIDGRAYFERETAAMIEREFGPDVDRSTITPVDICSLPPVPGLKVLPSNDEWPRVITAEEAASNALRSEAFLRLPVVHFPAEEASDTP